jgi:hypothetical protein
MAPQAIRSRTGNKRAKRKREKEDRRNSRKGDTKKETHVAICWIIKQASVSVTIFAGG